MIDMKEARNTAKRFVEKEVNKDCEVNAESTKIREVGDISVFETEGKIKVTKDPLHTEKKNFSVQVRADNGEVIGSEIK